MPASWFGHRVPGSDTGCTNRQSNRPPSALFWFGHRVPGSDTGCTNHWGGSGLMWADGVEPAARRVSGRHRVGVNLLWLVPGVVGGSEEYTTRLLTGLAERRLDDLELTLFALRPFAEAHPTLAAAFRTEILRFEGRAKPLRVAAETTWLAGQSRRHGLDLMHHGGGVVPLGEKVPSVLTIHDLQPLVIPEHFSRAKRTYLQVMLPRSARAARLVLTPSDYAGRSVVEHLGVPAEQVVTVPHGIAPQSTRTAPDPALTRRVRSSYHLTGPWFVYPAVTWPHKDHIGLVQDFATVAARHADVTLVLSGGSGGAEVELRAEIERLGLSARVRRTGRIPRAHLDALIAGATALVYPSRYEGFGAPVLEAMAAGCPVIAADATALSELVADAGLLVPPGQPGPLAAAMTELLTDERRRAELVVAGRERAGRFGWDRAAVALEGAYRRALAEPEPVAQEADR